MPDIWEEIFGGFYETIAGRNNSCVYAIYNLHSQCSGANTPTGF